jgi:hypothetical protein
LGGGVGVSYRPFSVTAKQPANLAVEGAEESLSILPDYTPTVRPPLLTILAGHAEPNV